MHSDVVYIDKVLYSRDPYEKLDALNFISSVTVLREIYKKTDDLFVKKEIVKICNDDRIYQLALNERNETLKIAVIRAIYRKLQSKWNLEDDEPENLIVVEAEKKERKRKSKIIDIRESEVKDDVTAKAAETVVEVVKRDEAIPESSKISEILEIPEVIEMVEPKAAEMGEIKELLPTVEVVSEIEQSEFAGQEEQEEQTTTQEVDTTNDIMEITTIEYEDVFAQENVAIPEEKEEKEEKQENSDNEKKTQPNDTTLIKQSISQIFNMYTLVDLLRSSPLELHDDIHTQIKRVLDSQRILDELDKM